MGEKKFPKCGKTVALRGKGGKNPGARVPGMAHEGRAVADSLDLS